MKNKYLEDLGLKRGYYGIPEFEDDKREKQWASQRTEYGFDERDTWDLGVLFLEWLYSHCCMYRDVNCVDLTYYRFKVNDKTYTQEEALNLIIKYIGEYLVAFNNDGWNIPNEVAKNLDFALELWIKIRPAMWW